MTFDYKKVEELLKDLGSNTPDIQASSLVSDLGVTDSFSPSYGYR